MRKYLFLLAAVVLPKIYYMDMEIQQELGISEKTQALYISSSQDLLGHECLGPEGDGERFITLILERTE